MIITKSDLLLLRKCPNWFWLRKNAPESLDEEANTVLIQEGDHFEIAIRELFPGGVIVQNYGREGAAETIDYVGRRDRPIFQATFLNDDVLVRADVLVPINEDEWDLYEIKASTEIKEQYIFDLAIQRAVIQDAGLCLRRCHLVIADRSYVRGEKLDVQKLACIDDLTAQSAAIIDLEVRPLIDEAKRIAPLPEMPVHDIAELPCVPNGPNPCGCAPISYAELPEYSVFDVTRLPRESCSKLLKKGIESIVDIRPTSIRLSRQQAIQVVLTQHKQQKIDRHAIASELGSLRYPLYFLDYETFNFAVPPLTGFRPYQQFVFQYSLHVLRAPDAPLEHSEFLADDVSIQNVLELSESLRDRIADDGGSVIVWHRSFEETRNLELAELFPKFALFFRDLNQRIFDLEDVFKNGHYHDYRLRGRSSIKVVLPVLCPDFSYTELNVQNGGQAMTTWKQLIDETIAPEERQRTISDLLRYCELDTLAMVQIFRQLSALVQRKA